MIIYKLKIINYKLFQNITIEMNDDINIFVGENDSGKTTVLEALSMVLTGKINGGSIMNRLNLDWFNATVRTEFKQAIENGQTPELPTIEITNTLMIIANIITLLFCGTINGLKYHSIVWIVMCSIMVDPKEQHLKERLSFL